MAKKQVETEYKEKKTVQKPVSNRLKRSNDNLKNKVKSHKKQAEETKQFFIALLVATVLLTMFLFFIFLGKK